MGGGYSSGYTSSSSRKYSSSTNSTDSQDSTKNKATARETFSMPSVPTLRFLVQEVPEEFKAYFTNLLADREKLQNHLWKIIANKMPAIGVYGGPTFAEYSLSLQGPDLQNRSIYLTNLKTTDSASFGARNTRCYLDKVNCLGNKFISFPVMKDYMLLMIWNLFLQEEKFKSEEPKEKTRPALLETQESTISTSSSSVPAATVVVAAPFSRYLSGKASIKPKDSMKGNNNKGKTVSNKSLVAVPPPEFNASKGDHDRFTSIMKLVDSFLFFGLQQQQAVYDCLSNGEWLKKYFSFSQLFQDLSFPLLLLSTSSTSSTSSATNSPSSSSYCPIVYCNSAMESMISLQKQQIIGNTVSSLFFQENSSTSTPALDSSSSSEAENKFSFALQNGLGVKLIISKTLSAENNNCNNSGKTNSCGHYFLHMIPVYSASSTPVVNATTSHTNTLKKPKTSLKRTPSYFLVSFYDMRRANASLSEIHQMEDVSYLISMMLSDYF
jgi:hypothetical protein